MRRMALLSLLLGLMVGIASGQLAEQSKGSKEVACPVITVSGPEGLTPPGAPIRFTGRVKGPVPNSATYLWTVSSGALLNGQGTLSIEVYNVPRGATSTATLEIIGLPRQCPSATSVASATDCPIGVILVDEFSVPMSKVDEVRLADAEKERSSRWPDGKLHIIEYFPAKASQFDIRAKIRMVKELLTKKLKIDESAFEIVTAEGEELLTKIYLVPPGADNPEP